MVLQLRGMWDDQSLQSRRPSSAGVSTHHTFDLLSEAEGNAARADGRGGVRFLLLPGLPRA